MELPRDCEECKLRRGYICTYLGSIVAGRNTPQNYKHPDCPLKSGNLVNEKIRKIKRG